jgi:hypothetical protein
VLFRSRGTVPLRLAIVIAIIAGVGLAGYLWAFDRASRIRIVHVNARPLGGP